MNRDLLSLPDSAPFGERDREALRTLADVMSHIRFMLANGNARLSRREAAILDLVDLVQDMPMAMAERRLIRLGPCLGFDVTRCGWRAQRELGASGYISGVGRQTRKRGADLSWDVLKTTGGLVLTALIGGFALLGVIAFVAGGRAPQSEPHVERNLDEAAWRMMAADHAPEKSR